jgi:hypothetical protein
MKRGYRDGDALACKVPDKAVSVGFSSEKGRLKTHFQRRKSPQDMTQQNG